MENLNISFKQKVFLSSVRQFVYIFHEEGRKQNK